MKTLKVIAGLLGVLILSVPGMPQSKDADRLAAILQKAREYCERLDRAALDFVCQERVEEKTNTRTAPSISTPPPTTNRIVVGGRIVSPARVDSYDKKVAFYEYMFVRKGGEVTERRDLVEKNGTKISQKDAAPDTRHFKFRNIMFGPSFLLGTRAALRHGFKIRSSDKIKGEPVVEIVCAPLPEYSKGIGHELSGRATVRVKDGAVLRIDWDPESFSSYEEVLAVAEKYRMDPKVQSVTEFGIEKNGVRFPTKDYTEEAYGRGASAFIRSMTTINYQSYKFFTVETKIEI